MEVSVVAAPTDIENQCDHLETLRKELDSLSSLSPSRCIYRVPDRFRSACEKAYKPRVVSIGPFHHDKNKALEAMEYHKKWYLKCAMKRTNSKLNGYIEKIKEQEKKLRSYYAETFDLESDKFVKIILVDAIFVIEFLYRFSYGELREENDCIFGRPRMVEDVMTDLLMLENQLPFFILEVLFETFFILNPTSVRKLSMEFLRHRGFAAFGITFESSPNVEGQHFVDLLRNLLIAPISKEPPMIKSKKSKPTPCIEKLHQSGVKFQIGSTKNLFDIRFDGGILKIPELKTGDSTEIVLRNLIAFEQCSATSDDYCISDYVSIMDELVDNERDVGLLVEEKIVKNDLGGGNQELAELINKLSTGILYVSDNFYYGDLCGNLDNFYSWKWHKWMAILRLRYFNSPWAAISFGACSSCSPLINCHSNYLLNSLSQVSVPSFRRSTLLSHPFPSLWR